MITFDDFKKLDLRVATVTACEPHPNADKLLVMQIDLGDEQRQIIAGLKQWYQPEEMTGKAIVVVTNLEPASIRGMESNGMLLAAGAGDDVVVIVPERDIPPGTKVT